MNKIRISILITIFSSLFITGCADFKTSSGMQKLTKEETMYTLSKNEPGKECKMVGGFDGYDTPCGSGFGSVPSKVQFSCIRKEITKAKGNYGVLDAVVGNGWYKGRIYFCP